MPRPKKTTTTPVKKRAYKKRKWTQQDHKEAIENIELLPPPEPISQGAFIATYKFVDAFEQFDESTKSRIMAYLSDRYKAYIPYYPKTN